MVGFSLGLERFGMFCLVLLAGTGYTLVVQGCFCVLFFEC
jgi:hypothetical protein